MQILNNIIFCLDNDWEAQMTKDIMEKAKEITDQIFSGKLDIWIEEKKKQFEIWKLIGSCITFTQFLKRCIISCFITCQVW